MSKDQTLFFKQCVQIYDESNEKTIAKKNSARKQKKLIGSGILYPVDKFNENAKQIFEETNDLRKLVLEVRPQYLLDSSVLDNFDLEMEADDNEDDAEYNNDDDFDYDDLNYVPGSSKTPTAKQSKTENPGISRVRFTEEDRDEFDSKTNLLLHKLSVKLKNLETYENERFKNVWFNDKFNNTSKDENNDRIQNENNFQKGKKTFSIVKNFIDFTFNKEYYDNANVQVNKYRKGILAVISLRVQNVSTKLHDMQTVRLSRKLEEKSTQLHIMNDNQDLETSYQFESNENLNNDTQFVADNLNSVNDSSYANKNTFNIDNNSTDPGQNLQQQFLLDEESVQRDNSAMYVGELSTFMQPKTTQQLQLLQREASQMLNSKLDELSKVKSLQKNTVEIATLMSKLTTQVELQANQLKSLEEELELTHLDINKGNKELKNAKLRGRRASMIIITVSILLSFILLFFDAVL